ncbi:adenylyltransferase/cytidyltransferase family protein [Candidatus Micrarchaeota archaeon]|nr:adenylyltransferase/cytidyltransferase family protein [Candidatus Micrarchaeota archaeon]
MKVMVAGVFDFLHPGHLALFRQAKKMGEIMVVVARDATVLKIKGKPPLFSEEQRAQAVAAIKGVDSVVLGDVEDNFKVLKEAKPDVLLLGYDQNVDLPALRAYLKENNLKTKIKRAEAFEPHKFKSSKLKKIFGV